MREVKKNPKFKDNRKQDPKRSNASHQLTIERRQQRQMKAMVNA